MKSPDCNGLPTMSSKRPSRWSPTAVLKRLWASYVRGCERAYRDLPPYSLY